MCINPRTIKNNRYDYHPLWHRAFLQVPCNECEECRNSARNQLSSRLSVQAWQTLLSLGFVLFLTFTYNNEHLPYIKYNGKTCPGFSRKDVLQFLRALHRYYDKKGMKFYHFLVCEYGKNTKRPHYHCMFFLPYGFDHQKFAEKAREFWTHMYIKEKDIYTNNGYMFPGKKGVKLGKHLCRSIKSACVYTAKYSCKDLSFYRLPIVAEICSCDELKKQYANYLPKVFQSCNLGYSWFHEYLLSNPAAVKCTNPATLQSINIPTYAINKFCYNTYKGDELNSKGERKVIRELNENGYARRIALLDVFIQNRADKYVHTYGYSLLDAEQMAIYHYVYRGLSSRQLYNWFDEIKRYKWWIDENLDDSCGLFSSDVYHHIFSFSLQRFSFLGVAAPVHETLKKMSDGYDFVKDCVKLHKYVVVDEILPKDIHIPPGVPPRLVRVAYASEMCEADMRATHINDVLADSRQREVVEELHYLTNPGADYQEGTADNCW